MNKINLIISSAYAAIVSSIFVVIITIWAELSPALKGWLKSISGHHWTTKSIFTALIFAGVLLALSSFRKNGSDRTKKSLILLLVFVFIGSITIVALYTGHHLQFW